MTPDTHGCANSSSLKLSARSRVIRGQISFASMKITVQLFARARDLAGTGRAELDLPAAASIADLRQSLAARFPEMSPLVPKLLVAIGTEYADDRAVLEPETQVSCFPPVSGG